MNSLIKVFQQYDALMTLRKLKEIVDAKLQQIDEAGKAAMAKAKAEDDEIAPLRSHWKKENGINLTDAGTRERDRCQKAGLQRRDIAKRMAISESGAGYVPVDLR